MADPRGEMADPRGEMADPLGEMDKAGDNPPTGERLNASPWCSIGARLRVMVGSPSCPSTDKE